MAEPRTKYYPLGGGLDLVTSPLTVNPGRALAMVNFEPHFNGGYKRIEGFERCDGRPRPSDATFVGFTVSNTTGLAVGSPVTGGTSGATGIVIGISGLNIGVTKVVGTFVNGESLGAQTITANPGPHDAPDQDTEDAFFLAAQTEYRDDIQPVPGSGEVRGVWQRDDDLYAIRNDAGGVAGILHRATASGWSTTGITMVRTLYFDAGGGGTAAALPVEGETVTGLTSGATGLVHRVVLHGGATGTNDAYGYLALRNVTGTFQDNEALRVSGTTRATANGVASQFAFPPGGTYRFLNHNFFGAAGTFRTYGVNAVGPAFEIDENHIVTPILYPSTAMADQPASNVPFLIEEHRNSLFFALPGGSLVTTVIGEPLMINGFLGSAEFGIGAEITGLSSVVGNVLVITTERFTRGLFGLDINDYELRLVGERTGGRLYTSQKIDTVYAVDDLGITSIARTDSFGDFAGSTVSQLIQPLLNAFRGRVTDTTIVRKSNQYRVYFDDGTGLIMYVPNVGEDNTNAAGVNKQRVQFGFLTYPIPVKRIYNSEDENGVERTYFVSEDGYVYEDQIGKSLDGEELPSYIRLVFNNLNSPSYRKYFRRVDIEMQAIEPMSFQFAADLSYGAPDISSSQLALTSNDIEESQVFAGGGFYDDSLFDEIYWDGQNISTARAAINGSGENIGFVFYHTSAIRSAFILQGLTIHYEVRRLQR